MSGRPARIRVSKAKVIKAARCDRMRWPNTVHVPSSIFESKNGVKENVFFALKN
jgi:hypothetical protein